MKKIYAVVSGTFYDSPDFRIDALYEGRQDAEDRLEDAFTESLDGLFHRFVRDDRDGHPYAEDADGNWVSAEVIEAEVQDGWDGEDIHATLVTEWNDGVCHEIHLDPSELASASTYQRICTDFEQEYGVEREEWGDHLSCEDPMVDIYIQSDCYEVVRVIDRADLKAYVENNIDEYEVLAEVAWVKLDKYRCPLEMADPYFYGEVERCVEDYCDDHGISEDQRGELLMEIDEWLW